MLIADRIRRLGHLASGFQQLPSPLHPHFQKQTMGALVEAVTEALSQFAFIEAHGGGKFGNRQILIHSRFQNRPGFIEFFDIPLAMTRYALRQLQVQVAQLLGQ